MDSGQIFGKYRTMTFRDCLVVILICYIRHMPHISAGKHTCPKEVQNCTCRLNSLSCDLKGYTSFPEDITMGLFITELSLTQNNLTEINDNHFKHFIHVSYMNLRQNQISTITENAFYHNTMLHRIELSKNRLKSLPINLFKRLVFLEYVYLEYNQLEVIESAHFQGLSNLKAIRLHNNHLTKVGSDAFINSPLLTELYLEDNRLVTPERNWLLHFDHTEVSGYELYLDNNPWSCDCRMKGFYDWAITKNWFVHHKETERQRLAIPECHEPPSLRGLQISSIDSQKKLICNGVNITSRTERVNAIAGLEIEISCSAKGLPTPVVSILDPDGRVLASGSGTAGFASKSASAAYSGIYHCKATGLTQNRTKIAVADVIVVNVRGHQASGIRHPASGIRASGIRAAGLVLIVLMSLLASALLLGFGVCYYKRYRHIKQSYGRVPNHLKSSEEHSASYSENNVDSMKGNSRQDAIASLVSCRADYEDDVDVTKYHKDTEFLV